MNRADWRSPPSISIDAATGSSQPGAPGCFCASRNHSAAVFGVVELPVVHESDVVVIAPVVRVRGNALLQKRHRQVRPPGPARVAFAQEDRAEAVSDREVTDPARW